ITRAFFVSLCIAVLGQPRSQLGHSCPQIRIGGCHDDPHNFRSQRRLSPALAGLSLRVSPDALGRSGLGANDGGIPVNQTNFDFRNIKRGADWWPPLSYYGPEYGQTEKDFRNDSDFKGYR